MRTILKLASEYAKYEELEFTFGVEHVLHVLEMVSIVDSFERSVIYRVFDYKYDGPKKSVIYTLKEYLETPEKLNENKGAECDGDVLEKISQVHAYGVDLYKSAIYKIYDGKLPLDYDDTIISKRELDIIIKSKTEQSTALTTEDFDELMESVDKGFKKLKNIKRLKDILNENVLNQESAVESICDMLIKSEHVQDTQRPNGILLFLGPPATGKTYLAKLLSENLDGYRKHIVIDMTQFTHKDSAGAFFGVSRQYGNASPGLLTHFVHQNPKSIIVFDEFEKSHVNIQNALLTIMSSGYLEDACGWCNNGKVWTAETKDEDECALENLKTKVDFSQTILIFTSNLGAELYSNDKLIESMKDKQTQLDEMLFKAISKRKETKSDEPEPYITPPLLSRLRQGKVVLFNKLKYTELKKIAVKTFESERMAFEANYDIKISYEEYTLDALLLRFAPSLDIRAIKSSIGKTVFDTVTDYYMKTEKEFSKVKVQIDKESKIFLEEILQDANEFAKDLRHKNRSLHFKVSITETKTILKLNFSDFEIITVKNPEHFGEDGISVEVPKISFSEIAGHSFVKNKLHEVVSLLKDYKTLNEYEIIPPKGMLLYGPPGTGKTMLAKALANEADLPFISTTGKDLLETGKIDKIFSIAREYAPSIIFIDELDSIPSRNNNASASMVINTLLTNIDGFETFEEPVFIIAATNIKDRIDGALLRSGRLDIHIEVAALDRDARRYFVNKMIDKEIFDNKIAIEEVLTYTTNLNGSDLEKVERECILFVLRSNLKKVTQEILIEQMNTIKYGRRVEDDKFENAVKETAYHEAGHAIVSKVLNPSQPIEQITVMPRNNALGFVSFSESDKYINQTKGYFESNICVSLAGRIAQAKKFGKENIDSGARSDLESANKLIYKAITRYGMDDILTNLNVSIFDEKENIYRNDMIFQRMQVWLTELTLKTEKVIDDNWETIEKLAIILIDKEQVDGRLLDELF